MATVNRKAREKESKLVDKEGPRLAGGYGPYSAKQSSLELLRRSVLACLLWEDLAYESGNEVAENIKGLIPNVEPRAVADLAIECRFDQKLRHVPLLLVREMARYKSHRHLVEPTLSKIINRPDEITEFLSIYWMDGKVPIAASVKRGLAKAFLKFDAYSLAKWRGGNKEIKLRDVVRLVHPKPENEEQSRLFAQLLADELPTPLTWESMLSSGKDKKSVWVELIEGNRLGALAFLRNLRNMTAVGVPDEVIHKGFNSINPRWLLPLNYLSAAAHNPEWEREIEALMFRGFAGMPKLAGKTIGIIDVSGSMREAISRKSTFTRLDAGIAMMILLAEMGEDVHLYATAGNDSRRVHDSVRLPGRRGFALREAIQKTKEYSRKEYLGGGGIFTRQVLEWVKEKENGSHRPPERIIIFSDSQDCDVPGKRIPDPFGRHNYIIDVSAHARGVAYGDIWDAEISGWSEHFLHYIAALESSSAQSL